MSNRSIVVIGPGAIGGAVAGALVEAGRQPRLMTRAPFDRLVVEHPTGRIDVAADTVTRPDELDPSTIVFVATKAHQSPTTKSALEAACNADTIVVIVQNGVEHVKRFRPLVPATTRIVPAVVALPSRRIAPGHVVVSGRSRLTIPAEPAASDIVDVTRPSFLEVVETSDWKTAAWMKLMMNAGLGAIGVLTRRDNRFLADQEAFELALQLLEEVADVGRAEGAIVEPDVPQRLIERVQRSASGHLSSIVVDRINGRPTEWRERNEVVVRLAGDHDIEVPLNRLMTTLIRLGEPTGDGEGRP